MYNPETVLVMICEMRELVDMTTDKLHHAKLEIQQLRNSNTESDANIRGLMDENRQLQEEIKGLKNKYETQRQ